MRKVFWQPVHSSVIDIRNGPLCVQLSLDAKPHLFELIANIFAVRPWPVNRIIAPPRIDVPMTVIDRLAGGPAIVNDDVEALGTGGGGDRPTESGQERAYRTGERVREVTHAGMVRFGHEQNVTLADRVDVEKGDGFVGLD
jgi:hypothetical protein